MEERDKWRPAGESEAQIRRGGEKNSAQPCFRFPPFSPRRL